MKDCEVVVRISDYGDISFKKNELIDVLEKNDIIFFMRAVNEIPWTDYGVFQNNGDDGSVQWRNCRDRGSYVQYRGMLYPCGRAFRQIEQGLYDESLSTRVNLYDPIEKMRGDMLALFKRAQEGLVPTYGCRFCGDMNKKIVAGVQMK